MFKARAVPVPSDSLLALLYVGTDLLDAFAIHLPAGAIDDLEVLVRARFGSSPEVRSGGALAVGPQRKSR